MFVQSTTAISSFKRLVKEFEIMNIPESKKNLEPWFLMDLKME